MPSITVTISRFVDEYQPGIVECVLVDALGESHLFVEKVPIVTLEPLMATSSYPCIGAIDCEVQAIWQDETGQNMVEYAVLLALILILVVGSVTLIGSTLTDR